MTENIGNIENAQDAQEALGDEVPALSHLSDSEVEEALAETLEDGEELSQSDHVEGEGQN